MTDDGSYGSGYTFDEQHYLRNDSELSDVLKGLLGSDVSERMSDNQRARAAWYGANGDIERKHTTGVYLDKSPCRKGLDPVLCVYVDSHVRLTDFSANRETYLSRMYGAGLRVSGIRFRLSDREHIERKRADEAERNASSSVPEPLPPLTQEEGERIARMTSDLPDGLRQKVSRAMELSFRRETQKRAESEKGGKI